MSIKLLVILFIIGRYLCISASNVLSHNSNGVNKYIGMVVSTQPNMATMATPDRCADFTHYSGVSLLSLTK